MAEYTIREAERAMDILHKWNFFYGQRAGRELWQEKPREIQDADIENFCRDFEYLMEYIKKCVPVVHGRWVEKEEPFGEFDELYAECSVCRGIYCHGEFTLEELCEQFPYCPNCGAQMNGKEI